MNAFIIWVLTFTNMYAPPGRPQYLPAAQETREEAVARYESIATDIHEVLQGEKSLFGGKHAKARTTAVLLSLMLHESGFRKDVDFGIGPESRGDGGRSWCMLQQNIGNGRTLAWNIVENRPAKLICKEGQTSTRSVPCDKESDVHPGWTGPELVADRKNCIRAGLRAIRMSFSACRAMPVNEWLRSYASGSCSGGGEASARRMNLAMTWFSRYKPEVDSVLFAPPAVNPAPPDAAAQPSLVSLR
jgi:hypothetical protein